MILVAFAAVAAAFLRPYLSDFFKSWGGPPTSLRTRMIVEGPVKVVICVAMMAVMVSRLAGPRPRLREIVREPGFAACVGAMAGLIAGLIRLGFLYAFEWGSWESQRFNYLGDSILEPALAMVAGAWLALLVCGRWKAVPSWHDRAGRLLGLYWLALIAEHALRPSIENWFPAF